MFVPVQVEIMPGAICVGIMPVRLEKIKDAAKLGSGLGIPTFPGSKLAFADMFRAECIATKYVGSEKLCQMDFSSIKNGGQPWVSEFRITDFTFGGVMVSNTKFDPIRIDQEDEAWLKANVKPDPNVKKKNNTAISPVAPGMKKP